tara:strand:- start:633 stop:788 length:156 start_codon:yes stop_codon:yes gene_type:complete
MGVSIFKPAKKARTWQTAPLGKELWQSAEQDTVSKAVDATEGDATHSQKGK